MKIGKAIRTKLGNAVAWMLDAAEPSPDRSARQFYDRNRRGHEDNIVSAWDRETTITNCRDLMRNNAITRGICHRLRDMVVGKGITPHAITSDPAWNRIAESYWHAWADRPEPSGLLTLSDILRLAVVGVMVEGGAVILKHSDGTIEPIEIERLRTHPKDPLGSQPYKLDASGRLTHWCIWDRDQTGAFSSNSRASWVRAVNVLTLMPRERPDQIMPMPQLAACVNQIRDLSELNSYTLRQAKTQSLPAVVLKKGPSGQGIRPGQRFADKDRPWDDFLDALKVTGFETDGDVHTLSPATPASTYKDFVALNLKLISMAVSIPLDVLMLWFSDGTYASNKTTLTQAHEAIEQRQQALIRAFLRPLWTWKITQAVANRELPVPPLDANGIPQFDRVDFRPPAYEWMDPADQLQSTMQAIQAGVSTLSEECEKRGTTLEQTLRRKAADLRTIRAIAAQEGVDPSELSQVIVAGAANLTAAPAQSEPTP